MPRFFEDYDTRHIDPTQAQIASVMLQSGNLKQVFEALSWIGIEPDMQWVSCYHTITGRGALVRRHPTDSTLALAQFDSMDHPHAGGWWAYDMNRFTPKR